MRVLVTGGAGYIGSHTVLQLLEAGHDALVYDNFSNSAPEALRRVAELAGKPVETHTGDIRDADALKRAFAGFQPEAVIHFAGLKAVGESEAIPLEYYDQNVGGTVALLRCMQDHNCTRFVFSSSATVYGEAEYLPYDEIHRTRPANAYGRTKHFIEELTRDWCGSWPAASALLLRYFNPVGAHASGLIGEDPTGVPNNLVPFMSQVAIGRRQKLAVFGDDYDTRDGSGERDYIHVEDLASAHVSALARAQGSTGADIVNVGTGKGTTVFEMIAAFEAATGQSVAYEVVPRRPGDVARMAASVDKARDVLGWRARYGLHEMCASAWNWQQQNPNGYRDEASA